MLVVLVAPGSPSKRMTGRLEIFASAASLEAASLASASFTSRSTSSTPTGPAAGACPSAEAALAAACFFASRFWMK
jgi:hypothetical protein